MPDRRQFLGLTALASATVCAGCATIKHPTATAGAAVTCPDIIPGSVSGQTGFFTALADAAALEQSGAIWQNQRPILASDRPGLCERQRAAIAATGQSLTKQSGETWLMVGLYRFNCVPGAPDGGADLTNFTEVPYPPTPITIAIGHGTEAPANSGRAYSVNGQYQGASGSAKAATAGTVTVTTWTLDQVELTYDLTFKPGRLQGAMTAPGCVIC
jgi:hypothetical protein